VGETTHTNERKHAIQGCIAVDEPPTQQFARGDEPPTQQFCVHTDANVTNINALFYALIVQNIHQMNAKELSHTSNIKIIDNLGPFMY
jgi:desulfoferrodoxin (superoxide reductase-like protein)